MYKLITEVLTTKPLLESADRTVTKNIIQSKILFDLTHSVDLTKTAAIASFIAEIPRSDNLNKALKPILLHDKLDLGFVDLLEAELSKSMPKLAFKRQSELLLPKNVAFTDESLTANDIQKTIERNAKLKSLATRFIDTINKNKLRLSVITLSAATVGAYLHDSAKNLSGCYKTSKNGTIVCKVKSCDSQSLDKSLNNKFCSSFCYEGTCDEQTCNALNTKSNYTCINVKWYQALGYIVNEFGSDITQSVFKIIKFALVFIMGLVTYNLMSNYNWKYRFGVSTVNALGLSLMLFQN